MTQNSKIIQWVLRIAIAGEFAGHGLLALQGKQSWIGWIGEMTGVNAGLAAKILSGVGTLDLLIALLVLFKPIRIALLWAAFWGFWTALMRPLVGEPVLDFIERWTNWGAPLALLLLSGWPRGVKDWLRSG